MTHSPWLIRFCESWKIENGLPVTSGPKFLAYFDPIYVLIIFPPTVWVYLVPVSRNLPKSAEKVDFQTRFSRDWDIFGKNGYVRSTRHKKFFKMSTSCVFRKKWPSDLNLARSWSLDVWSEKFFQNFAKNPWNWAYFVQKKITNKSPKSVWVHLVPRFF